MYILMKIHGCVLSNIYIDEGSIYYDSELTRRILNEVMERARELNGDKIRERPYCSDDKNEVVKVEISKTDPMGWKED